MGTIEPYIKSVNSSSICLICSSLVNTSEIKEEPIFDQNLDGQSVINFLLATLLEIPRDDQHSQLTNEQLNTTLYCESCTKLIHSAKAIYTDILELTRKFREVQKQIVQKISNFGDLQHGSRTSTSIYHEILVFCRKFLTKNDFNGFGYPLIVNEIPLKLLSGSSSASPRSTKGEEEEPLADKVKEELISENEDDFNEDDDDSSSSGTDKDEDYKEDKDNHQNSSSSSSSADEENETESDSDFEPPSPQLPKKAVKKIPSKKPTPQRQRQRDPGKLTQNRKERQAQGLASTPLAINKIGIRKRLSKFERLHPNYPKLTQNPTTKNFHCLESSCSKSYPRKSQLEGHILIQHLQDNLYKCKEPNCKESYFALELYQDHVSWHAGIPRWKCEEKVVATTISSDDNDGKSNSAQCTQAFFSRKKLNRHVQMVHHPDNPFICEQCGKRYSCQDYLTCHKYEYHNKPNQRRKPKPASTHSTHLTDSTQICNHCGKSYATKASLRAHINTVHEKTVGKYPCQFCELRFWAPIQLKIHLFRHHKYSLDGFQIKPNLNQNYPYQCDVKRCKKLFAREDTWKKHMEEKHGKEEVFDFNCKYCGKGFHLKWKLNYHEEAHENKESKPYKCELCGNGFATMPYLKMHKKNIHKIPFERTRQRKSVKNLNVN